MKIDENLNEENQETNNEENLPGEEIPVENNQDGSDFEAMFKDMNDRYLRLYSEFDNFRKRTQKEKAELIKSAGADIMKAFLPILDDFERAVKANENLDDLERIKEGFVLIYNKTKHQLESKGLQKMDVNGKEFDAELCEAIANVPVEESDKKGKIIDVVENGYYLNNTVIRYAKVVVGQ